MKRLRVLALMHEHLVPPKSIDGMTDEQVNPFKMEWDVSCGLERLGHELHVLGVADEIAPVRRKIEELKPHICFNLLTHFHDVGAYQPYVVSYLELLKTPYTGCNPRGLLLAGDKALSKKVLAYHRIRVPRFATFRRGRKVPKNPRVDFPVIVKSQDEEASIGISQASIVHDLDGLRERVDFVHRNVGTDAIAEEYIVGRELTVSVIGNDRLQTFPVFELTFDSLPEGTEPIMTSRVKWDLKYQEKIGIKSGPAELPEKTARDIARSAKRIYRALNLSGCARIDLRLAPDGRVYVLEANPNPDLCFGEDFTASAEKAGLEYGQVIQRLLTLGMSYQPPWKD